MCIQNTNSKKKKHLELSANIFLIDTSCFRYNRPVVKEHFRMLILLLNVLQITPNEVTESSFGNNK